MNLPVHIGPDAVPALVRYAEEQGLRRLLLVADERTYAALGARVEDALTSAGREVIRALLAGEEVIADAARILEVLLAADERPDAYLAVGSGTITDITRFASDRSGLPFLAAHGALGGWLCLGELPLIVGASSAPCPATRPPPSLPTCPPSARRRAR